VADRDQNRVLQFACNNSTPTPAPSPTATTTPTPLCGVACVLTPSQNASLVTGQPNFTTESSSPVNASSLNMPDGVFQAGNVLAVVDGGDNRILIYNPVPTSNGASAVTVIGQPSMTSNTANNGGIGANTLSVSLGPDFGVTSQVWTDGTILIVADTGNNRVLIYNNINPPFPAVNGLASVVIGQANFTTNSASTGASGLSRPTGVFYDGQRLFISDSENSRILVYNGLPTTNGAPAALVLGQTNFTNNSSDLGTGIVTAQALSSPAGLWVYNGSLIAADDGNGRVVIYNNAGQGIDTLTANDPPADAVVGQTSFTASGIFQFPNAVSAADCQLYVCQSSGSDDILVYNSIPTSGAVNPAASVTLGTPGSIGPALQNNFSAGAVAAVNNLIYVADVVQNRVLQFSCQSGSGSSMKPLKGALSSEGGHPALTPTSTPTQTPTFTASPSPTPTPFNGLLASAVAAPNISRNGEPVKFLVDLGRSAQVHLMLFSLSGEEIYQSTVEGQAGVNNLVWQVENSANEAVASGLYVYHLQINDGQTSEEKTGKVVVLR